MEILKMISFFNKYILNIIEYLVDKQNYHWNTKLY